MTSVHITKSKQLKRLRRNTYQSWKIEALNSKSLQLGASLLLYLKAEFL